MGIFVVSTSKLQRRVSEFLSVHFGGYVIYENVSPEWLSTGESRPQLDFYIPALNLAIEVQGEQHFQYVPFFHKDKSGFEHRLSLDEFKRETCQRIGTKLIEICDEADVINLLDQLPQTEPEPFVPDKVSAAYQEYLKCIRKEHLDWKKKSDERRHVQAVERKRLFPKRALTPSNIQEIKDRLGLQEELPIGEWSPEIKALAREILNRG